MDDYDYGAAGFDGFLSRSIDDLTQVTLDSQGPTAVAIAYDRNQQTGAVGDSFKLGSGIELSGKDNAINLTDGSLNVTDTSTGASLQASSGNITYFDSQGNLVVQEGLLPNSAVGIRIVDINQVGLAQFARDKDGNTALKIAQAGIEVTTARNDQLVFNSNQDIFKIVASGTASLTVTDPFNSGSILTATIIHNLGMVPAALVYVNIPSYGGYTGSGQLTMLPANVMGSIGGSFGELVLYSNVRVDSSNIYIDIVNPGGQNLTGFGGTWTFKYYILQETAT